MLARTEEFKEEITKLGRQIDFKIKIYANDKIITEDDNFLITEDNMNLIVEQFNSEEVSETITSEDIYNVSIVTKGNLLTTIMKEVDFEIKQELNVGESVDCSFGLKVGEEYEWIDYGRYIIYSREFNEDTQTYSYISYDSMLVTMKDVNDVSLIQGVSIKTAIENICDKVGLNIEITADDVTNYPNLNNIINEEAFNNIEMTYRDVLDMICQALGLTMVSDKKNLYLKDINKGNLETHEVEGININLEDIENGKIKEFLLKGNTEQSGTPSPSLPQEVEVVRGNNKITIESGTSTSNYDINMPIENLLPYPYYTSDGTINGLTFTTNNDGSLTINGTSTADTIFNLYLNNTNLLTKNISENYILSQRPINSYINLYYYEYYNNTWNYKGASSTGSLSFTPSSQATGQLFRIIVGNSKTINATFNLQLEKGNNINSYTPYGTIPIELCKIGDYQDYIYKENGNWYKHCEIGKIVIDGSYSPIGINTQSTNTTRAYIGQTSSTPLSTMLTSGLYSDMLVNKPVWTPDEEGFYLSSSGQVIARINKSLIGTTVSEIINYLSSHNITIYYVLNTPVVEIITNQNLINQLNALQSINLYNGINNITTITSNMLPYIKIKYNTGYGIEEFDAEYLKNINVKFGKKYMINSVVLSRSEDTDTINRRDEESIALNGVHEFKIKDNLILNFNDREDYIDEIFNQLNGLEYYINDFTSTGITYLEPLDMYNVSIDDNSYQCLLLNDEIKINQGLEENIYTEEPEETTTDYKTSGKTDKEVSFIVDKQNGKINAKVSKGEVINEINLDESGAEINAEKISLAGKEIKLTSDDITIASTNFNVDKNGNITANNANISGSITSSNISGGTLNGTTITGGSLDINTDIFTNGITVHNSNNSYIIKMTASAIQGFRNGTQTFLIAPSGTGSYKKITTSDGIEIGLNGELTCYGNAFIQGSLTVQGSKNRVIDIGNKKVLMNAYETATPYFGDIGSDMTNEKGYCKINIEEVFSKTIELDDYKVFIQECGEGNLYVEKHDRYFEVLGTPNLKFDWEIKAIQKDYKDTRLDEFKKESDK